MKTFMLVIPVVLVVAACDKDSTAETPKAVEVKEEVIVVADPPPAELKVVDPENPQTPGEHLDRALQKTGQGLQVAGEKTEEGIETAREKTEAGLEKAAEKTGEFLKKVGEKIEEEAERVDEEEP